MAIQSLSIRRLNDAFLPIISRDTLAIADLWEVVRIAHAATSEMGEPAKRMVVATLKQTIEWVCQRFDGEPMTIEVHDALLPELRKVGNQSLAFLISSSTNAETAIAICNKMAKFRNTI